MNGAIFKVLVSFAIFFGLCSCATESDSGNYGLMVPGSIRYVQSLDNNEIRVDIRVNQGAPQSFALNIDNDQISLAITGVLLDQQNVVEILWYEMVDGARLPLARQEHDFFADGNTVVDTPHDYLSFDYDGDGISNYDERVGGTCVWSAVDEQCINPGDGNLLLNGDFSDGSEYWWTTNDNSVVQQRGELCVLSDVEDTFIWDAQFGYEPELLIEANSTYRITFNARAQNNSSMLLSLLETDETGFQYPVFQSQVDVFNTDQLKTVIYDSGNDTLDSIVLAISVGNATENRYCVSNFRMVIE